MGPTAAHEAHENDFVLTLSDGATQNGSSEPEDDAFNRPSKKQGQKRKRKPDFGINDAPAGRSKKHKASDDGPVKEKGVEVTNDVGAREPQDSEVEIEDDGAIISDFEFVNGDTTAVGVLEDFDGWEDSGVSEKTVEDGKKATLGLEEIIARRRRGHLIVEDQSLEATEDRGFDGDQAQLAEGSSRQEGTNGFDADEDEFLAEDAFGAGAAPETISDLDGSDEEEEENDSEASSIASPNPHPDDRASEASSQEEDEKATAEAARRQAFFAAEEPVPDKPLLSKSHLSKSFQNMSLSRPVLRGLAAVGFLQPTPIQAKTIPIALLGKDVVGGAVTGSGKTAAFLVPILERLLYRPKRIATSRVAILMPTRELAVQCYNVAKKFATYTDVTFCLLVGGLSLREQESELRKRPDIIIATPGRFIDHMRNSASFTLDNLEILVLDEADRMLEDGFADELNEILTTIPKSRQTMLFSATMTESVDKLVRVGMTRPVRLMVDARKQTVSTLTQEFVRLRPGREDKRLGYLMCLCKTVHTNRVIVFFRQKREAHRVRIIFGLFGLKASELHGSMSQEQRLHSVEAFRDGRVSFLLATDVASRGLDIKGVETVINYEAPQSHEIYLHRVGRTARAGRAGRACTLAAETDRKVVKAAVKTAKAQGAKIVSRVVEPADADVWAKKVEELQGEIEEVLKEEREEKQLAQAETQVRRGENLITHKDEIMARPKRTWFESETQKRAAKTVGRVELNGDEISAGKGKGKGGKRKLSGKEKKTLEDRDERREGKIWKKKTGKQDPDVKTKRTQKAGGGSNGVHKKRAPAGKGGRGGKRKAR